MRKRIKNKKLGRNKAQRKSLLRGLINSLIEKETIQTTYPKAKETKRLLEKFITTSKKNTIQARREIQSFLQNKENTKKIVDVLSKRFKDKTGGYIKLQKIGRRRGDNAMMAEISVAAETKKKEPKKQPEKTKKEEKKKQQEKQPEKPKPKPTLKEGLKDQAKPSETSQPDTKPAHQQQKKV